MGQSGDDKLFQNLEGESRSVLGRARNIDLSPSPYLASRISAHLSAHLKAQSDARGKLVFWRFVTSFSVAMSFVLAILVYQGQQPVAKVEQSYVIHVDFSSDEAKRVASAEVELPDGVHFASNNEEIRGKRSLKLPIHAESEGKFKLPFVLRSNVAGTQILKVHLYDENSQIVREREIKVKFAKGQSGNLF